MAPAGLGKSSLQRPVIGLQEHDLAIHALLLELFDRAQEISQKSAFPDIHAEGHALKRTARAGTQLRHLGEKLDRKVIDAEKSEVLETVDRLGFPRSRHARHNPE